MTEQFPAHDDIRGEPAGRVYSVSELTRLIKGRLEEEFSSVWVEGEISTFTRAQSGHLYFNLKDAHSQVKAVMFRSRLSGVRFELENGLKVIARGQVSVYPPRGEYQLIVEKLEPRGVGALQLAFEQMKARLAAEGLFKDDRKRPIPFLPETVGVVTSPTGAAIRDIINVMHRRFSGVGIYLYPVRVQGEGSAAEIARGIRELNDFGVDVIIVGRGGGSLEDLWAFNEEEVARAVFASRIPVISAVGHEIDFTISDFVADLRAPTPSAAAELVVKNRLNLIKELKSLNIRLNGTVREAISRHRSRLDGLMSRRVLTQPEYFLMNPRQRLDDSEQSLKRVIGRVIAEKKYMTERFASRLARFDPRARLVGLSREAISLARRLSLAMNTIMGAQKKKLAFMTGQLNALSPLAVLGRGYSICRNIPEKAIVSNAEQVRIGSLVSILLHRGALECRVTGMETDSAHNAEKQSGKRHERSRGGEGAD